MTIKDKIALVTGGAHRIGKDIVKMLSQEGAHVIFFYHSSKDAAELTHEELKKYGVRCLPIQCDISNIDDVLRVAEIVKNEFGHIDFLINNSSRFEKDIFPTEDLTPYKRVMSTTVDGTFYVCNTFVPLMKPEGAIINLLDLSIYQPWPGLLSHAMAKSALHSLTIQLAARLAPSIRVNAIAPGYILPPENFSENQKLQLGESTLLKCWGKPSDVSLTVKFLLEASYITGEVIHVDGGQRIFSDLFDTKHREEIR